MQNGEEEVRNEPILQSTIKNLTCDLYVSS